MAFPSLPFFVDAWSNDTAHLTRVERDIYLHLLLLCWNTPGCRVPNDVAWVARRLRCTQEEIPILKNVITEFMTSDGNWLTQKRLMREFAYVTRRWAQGREAAKARWEKRKKINGASQEHIAKSSTSYNGSNTPEPLTLHLTPEPKEERKEDDANASSEKRKKPAQGTRLQRDWRPSEEVVAFGVSEGFSREEILSERLDEFKDYWCSLTGQRATKLDWNATYRNRLRDLKQRRNGNGRAAFREEPSALQKAAERLKNHLRGETNDGGSGESGDDVGGLFSDRKAQ